MRRVALRRRSAEASTSFVVVEVERANRPARAFSDSPGLRPHHRSHHLRGPDTPVATGVGGPR